MSILVDVVNSIIDVEQTIVNFFNSGVYDLLTKFAAWFIQWSMVGIWKAKLALLTFSWGVAEQIIQNLNISSYLNTAWSSLDSRVLSMLTFFKIPDVVNIILSASVTKFVFRFLGF